MRISDWSSDVCSSDLYARESDAWEMGADGTAYSDNGDGLLRLDVAHSTRHDRWGFGAIGRASCRARVCQSVSISAVAVSLHNHTHPPPPPPPHPPPPPPPPPPPHPPPPHPPPT